MIIKAGGMVVQHFSEMIKVLLEKRQVRSENAFMEQCVLDTKFYNLLKYSLKKYNKINHFE